ncbi:hypothetical protein ANO11243_023180 [Dothideomycetidae sp. 11243]|nr:hypothetical protein ANO11243_023180 [fungal sp. No.11243]
MPLRSRLTHAVGTDIIKLSRLARYAEFRAALPFARRILTARELAAFSAADITSERRVQFLASRWAAKEAVIKTFPRRRLFHRDVEVYTRPEGAPFAVVLDRRADSRRDAVTTTSSKPDSPALVARPEQLAPMLDGALVALSIAHEDEYAVAVAVADVLPDEDDLT